MPYDADSAKKAAELYAAIATRVAALRRIQMNVHMRQIKQLEITAFHKASFDGYRDTVSTIVSQDGLDHERQQKLINFAIALRVEYLQERINAHGRQLAQLGFQKPPECK